MNTVFSVDDISDVFWSASTSGAAAGMNRSQSEWALERFLDEFSGSDENSKAEKGDGNGNHNPRPSDSTPTVPIDSDEYRAFLKNKLEQACAAVALFRASAVKTEGLSTQADQVLQSGSYVQSSSKAREQDEPDAGSLAVSTAQKKSRTQVRKATSESSREDSDDGELEGDTKTIENMDLADAKRARRCFAGLEADYGKIPSPGTKELGGTVSGHNITAVPTVQYYKEGKKEDEVVGADATRIIQNMNKIYNICCNFQGTCIESGDMDII